MNTTIDLSTVLGRPSWRLHTESTEFFITERGGQMGPVRFRLGDRWISPYSVAPWAQEILPPDVPMMLQVLRGDFFCMPFGGNEQPWHGEHHPQHGETANGVWKLVAVSADEIVLEMETVARRGVVRKTVTTRQSETVIYSNHSLQGYEGPMCMGHHAMLRFASEGLLSFCPFVLGHTFPGEFEKAGEGGRSSLRPGAEFSSLDSVPSADGSRTDLSRYPARAGFEDLVLLASDTSLQFSWSAVSFPQEHFVWFALKDPSVLASTVLWFSNGGRSYSPWNGRHRNVLGIEDVTAYFHLGLAASASPNPLSRAGHPTVLQLHANEPTHVRYIQGVTATPAGFGQVDRVTIEEGGIMLHSGLDRAFAKLDLSYL